VRLAFLGGSGHHYLRHLLAEPAHADLEVAVAGDGHDAAASAGFAESIRQVRPDLSWFDDGRQLLDRFRPDVVSVGAVYGHNGDWNGAALERGVAVVTDKPAAGTWGQLDRLRAAIAAGPSRVLLTEFDFRSRPEFRAARDAVAAGRVGDVVLVTAQKSYRFGSRPSWYADRSDYGGTLMWVASHGLDAVRFVGGRRIVRVVGRQGNVSRPDMGSMEDHVAVLAQLDGGGTAVVHADFCRPAAAPTHGDDRIRVAGSRGVVEVRDGRCVLVTHDVPMADITNAAVVRPVHHELWAAATGEPSPYYSTAESLAAAELLLRARDAADWQRWVDV
jgi:predicted dehydrogenase